MQTPPNMNDQQSWGGQLYQQPPPVSSPISNDQPTLIAPARPDAPVYVAQPLTQAGFLASSSNNLFHPVSNVPPSSYVYFLPNVPSNPCYHTYNPPNTFHLPLPYQSPFSSYNNPNFSICPSLPQAPLPPVTPHVHSHSVYHNKPGHFVNHQPAYNHHQPAYIPHQPPAFTSVPHHFSSPPFLYQPQPVPVSHIVNTAHVLAPSPSPVATIPKTLPTVTHIPLLTSKAIFPAWDEGVTSLIRANNLFGHILDPSAYVDPTRHPSPSLSCLLHLRHTKLMLLIVGGRKITLHSIFYSPALAVSLVVFSLPQIFLLALLFPFTSYCYSTIVLVISSTVPIC